jgi:hypothetical protein
VCHTPKSVVLITCETSGDLVPTGLHARSIYELPTLNVLVGCDRCGEDHEWTRDGAVITVASD